MFFVHAAASTSGSSHAQRRGRAAPVKRSLAAPLLELAIVDARDGEARLGQVLLDDALLAGELLMEIASSRSSSALPAN